MEERVVASVTAKVEERVVASVTAKVDCKVVASTTVKVLPKLTSPTISPLPEAIKEPDTSKLALVESLRLPIPVEALALWKVTTSNETSLVLIKRPLLSRDNTVTSSPVAVAPRWRELPLTYTALNGLLGVPRSTLL